MIYDYNGNLAIINLLIWFILLLTYKSEFFQYVPKKTSYSFLFLMVILYTTFGFSEADTYHYHEIYDEMLKFGEAIHVEPFYYWLIQFLPHNYYIWRFVVWGIAIILMIATFKRFNLNSTAVGFVFPLILLQQFTVTRGCLGIALFIYSLSFLLKPSSHRVLSYIFAISGCVLSLFLHRSMPLFIIMVVMAFVPLNKTLIIISILAYPLIRAGIMPHIFSFINSGFFSDETADFAQHYLQSEQSIANFNGILRLCLDYIPRFLIFIFLIKEYIFNNHRIDKPMKFLLQYAYILFYIALLFFGQETSSFISSRTIHMMCFPLTIVLAYHLTINYKRSALLKASMSFFICSDLFAFIYTIYKTW